MSRATTKPDRFRLGVDPAHAHIDRQGALRRPSKVVAFTGVKEPGPGQGIGHRLEAAGGLREEEVAQAHRASRVFLKAAQPQRGRIEIDDQPGRRIEQEERVVGFAKEAATDLEMAACRVHEPCRALDSRDSLTSHAGTEQPARAISRAGGEAARLRSP